MNYRTTNTHTHTKKGSRYFVISFSKCLNLQETTYKDDPTPNCAAKLNFFHHIESHKKSKYSLKKEPQVVQSIVGWLSPTTNGERQLKRDDRITT